MQTSNIQTHSRNPMTSFAIRLAASEADWQQAKNLLEELVAHERALRPHRKIHMTDDVFAFIAQNIKNHQGICLLALNNQGHATGLLNAWIEHRDNPATGEASTGYIADVYVRPKWRRRGVFKQLFADINARFKAAGTHSVIIESLVTNTEMRDVLLKSGFQAYKTIFEYKLG